MTFQRGWILGHFEEIFFLTLNGNFYVIYMKQEYTFKNLRVEYIPIIFRGLNFFVYFLCNDNDLLILAEIIKL